MPYIFDRTLIHGNVRITLPERHDFGSVARAGAGLMAVIWHNGQTAMTIYDGAGRRLAVVPDVSNVKSSRDGQVSAYATWSEDDPRSNMVTYRDNRSGRTESLQRPNDYILQVLTVQEDVVHFRAVAVATPNTMDLYRWRLRTTPNGPAGIQRIHTVLTPMAVTGLGTHATTQLSPACAAVVAVSDGKLSWTTCAYWLTVFSADGQTVLAARRTTSPLRNAGIAVLSNANGRLIREWRGVRIPHAAFEDDGHLLFPAVKGGKGAIVRCAVSSGRCELATELLAGVTSYGEPFRLGDLAYMKEP